jgi:hypothetical protein
MLSLAVGGIGIATAANGGSLLLGHHNKATSTTTLTDKKGTPLSLIGKKSKPPLKVNSSKLVKNLNAAKLGGLTPDQLSTGSSATFKFDLATALAGGNTRVIELPLAVTNGSKTTFHPVQVARTAPLPAGTYMTTAVAILQGDAGALCYLSTGGTFPGKYAVGVTDLSGGVAQEAVETDAVTIAAQQHITEYCFNADANSSDDPAFVASSVITSVRVAKNLPGVVAPTVSTAVRHRSGAALVVRH